MDQLIKGALFGDTNVDPAEEAKIAANLSARQAAIAAEVERDRVLRAEVSQQRAAADAATPVLTSEEVIKGCALAHVNPYDIDYKDRREVTRFLAAYELDQKRLIEDFWMNLGRAFSPDKITRVFRNLPPHIRKDVENYATKGRQVAEFEKHIREETELMARMEQAIAANKELVGTTDETKLREINDKLARIYLGGGQS